VHAVLFDWDGTLVDTLPFMFAATEHVMAEYGAARITWADYRRHFSPGLAPPVPPLRIAERDIESVGVRWWSVYRAATSGAPAGRGRGAATARGRRVRARGRDGRPPR